jgi:hypothetical protein
MLLLYNYYIGKNIKFDYRNVTKNCIFHALKTAKICKYALNQKLRLWCVFHFQQVLCVSFYQHLFCIKGVVQRSETKGKACFPFCLSSTDNCPLQEPSENAHTTSGGISVRTEKISVTGSCGFHCHILYGNIPRPLQ